MSASVERCVCFLATAYLLLATSVARGQSPASGPSTLAEALQEMPPGEMDKDTLLVVDAVTVKPVTSPNSTSADPSTLAILPSALSPIADRFDRSFASFHSVSAFGPRTMQVLNVPKPIETTPATVSIFDATRMLFGSLTEEQWRAAGGDGLSLDSLTDTQQQIYTRLICRPMLVVPASIALPDYSLIDKMDKASTEAFVQGYTAAEQTISGNEFRSATKLHVYFMADFSLHNDSGQSTAQFSKARDASPPGIDYRLTFHNQPAPGPGPLDDARGSVPNVLKPSDLGWDDRRLAVNADFRSAADVDDLVRIAAAATGLELHVSPHYAGRKVTFAGSPPVRTLVGDVLQALDFAISATWRKVGTAYVLTDDILGLGTRRYWIHSIVDPYDNSREQEVTRERSNFDALPLYKDVGFLSGDRLSIPPAVLQKLEEGGDDDIDTSDLPATVATVLKQEASLLVADEYRPGEAAYPTKLPEGEARAMVASIGMSTRVRTRLFLHLAVDTPAHGRVQIDDGISLILYRYKPSAATAPDPTIDVQRLDSHPLAVAALPATADEARRIVDHLADAGVHQFYCPAFYGGESYFPSKILPPIKTDHGGVVAAAIDEGYKRGVEVSAVVQLMRWKDGVDRVGDRSVQDLAEEDLTIGGETARQALQHINPVSSREDSVADADALNGIWVSPADPHVVQILTNLISEIAAIPGLKSLEAVPKSLDACSASQ